MNINLLEEPPTQQEIDRELAETKLINVAKRKAYKRGRLYVVCAIVCICGGVMYFWPLHGFSLFVICLVFLMIGNEVAYQGIGFLDEDEFKKIDQHLIDDVLKACELDTRADQYRLKVVAQGRALINKEAEIFRWWHREGFQRNRAIYRVRQNAPINAGFSEAATIARI